jgi:hypothetical protein
MEQCIVFQFLLSGNKVTLEFGIITICLYFACCILLDITIL